MTIDEVRAPQFTGPPSVASALGADPQVQAAHSSPAGVLGDVPIMTGGFTRWKDEVSIWRQLNCHLDEQQRAALIMLSLRGEARTVAQESRLKHPGADVKHILQALREFYIPNETQYAMSKMKELWTIKKKR